MKKKNKTYFTLRTPIDFSELSREEALKKIQDARKNKKIAIARNYEDVDYLKPAKGFPNYYLSDDGTFAINTYNHYVKKPTKNAKGYMRFQFFDPEEKKMKPRFAHVLVANTFLPIPEEYEGRTEVDHIDRDKSNNSWTNLRFATREENLKNRVFRKKNKF